MNIEAMTRDEKSLLLFFESRAVDYGGRVNTEHMNDDDAVIAKAWDKSRFVRYGRIASESVNRDGAMWCQLSDEAMVLAHQLRQERAKRMWEHRTWQSTEEKRNA